ncbi:MULTISPECIES: zinc-binding dehydrogenase [Kitasatospora]|uniref:Putative oxidoreductase n=1 Tax=Kitasatospora setae (strain ATCC 33774 / DSM 43861 / JCM 3304 / KCC A-0304 / NBRC 14216 / KM-6054) TaxID=452652 RepID=E4N215_KITSK|nr:MULTISPECIES: zinc-binding dehydrogenase [Kitasatospora]BAJ32199.1 putative oxidoreductase [Kitasatospora setae KM-6054]
MRAVWLREFGGPEVLVPGAAPDPVPGEGQVLIDVAHANLTFVETQFRATGRGPFAGRLPMIPGNGVGGTVTALGPGADPGWLGRRVVSATGGSGGYAELAAVPAEGLHPVPDGLPLDAATALLADGRTARLLLETAAPAPGERVLVTAAAGGVGTLLVQLATAAGAHVVAAAGGPRKLALAAELGAPETADYLRPDWADRIAPVDAVLDGVGGALGRAAVDLLRDGGRLINHGLAGGAWTDLPADEAAARRLTVLALRPTPASTRAATGHVLAEARAHRLRPVIGRRFPLERAADAHRAIEARDTLGKTLLDVDG